MTKALLHLATEVDAEVAPDFDRWSDGHVVANLDHPGFLSVRRFVRDARWTGAGRAEPHLTIYQLEDLAALTSDSYRSHDPSLPPELRSRLRYERSVFQELEPDPGPAPEPKRGRAIFHVITEVEPGFERDFHAWYAGEHVPAVVGAPGVLGARVFQRVADPSGQGPPPSRYTCLALYELEDPLALTQPEAVAAAQRATCPPVLEPRRAVSHAVYLETFSA